MSLLDVPKLSQQILPLTRTGRRPALIITLFEDGSVLSDEFPFLPRDKESISRMVGNLTIAKMKLDVWAEQAIGRADFEEDRLLRLLSVVADERKVQ